MAKRGRKPAQLAEAPMTEEQKLISDIRDIINEPSQRNPEKMVEEVLDTMPEEPKPIKEEPDSIKNEPIPEVELNEKFKTQNFIASIIIDRAFVHRIIDVFLYIGYYRIKIVSNINEDDVLVEVYEYV